MNREELLRHWKLRRERIRGIRFDPDVFKVCDQCRSIYYKSARICSFCGAYRFNFGRDVVLETTRLMGLVPFPYTAPVVPRSHDGFCAMPAFTLSPYPKYER